MKVSPSGRLEARNSGVDFCGAGGAPDNLSRIF